MTNSSASKRIARGRIGDVQQRLGQNHQRHARPGAERVFLKQRLRLRGSGGVSTPVLPQIV